MRRTILLRLAPKVNPVGKGKLNNENIKKTSAFTGQGKGTSKIEEIYSRLKNPRTEGEAMARSIAIGVGICCIGIITSIIGLR